MVRSGRTATGPDALLGLSIENAAKGILTRVGIGTELRDHNGILTLPSVVTNHNLVGLVRDCGQTVTEKEGEVLEELTEWVKWRGRYPVPTNHLAYGDQAGYSLEATYSVGSALLQRLLDVSNASSPLESSPCASPPE